MKADLKADSVTFFIERAGLFLLWDGYLPTDATSFDVHVKANKYG